MVGKEGNEVANFASCALRNTHERGVRRGEMQIAGCGGGGDGDSG